MQVCKIDRWYIFPFSSCNLGKWRALFCNAAAGAVRISRFYSFFPLSMSTSSSLRIQYCNYSIAQYYLPEACSPCSVCARLLLFPCLSSFSLVFLLPRQRFFVLMCLPVPHCLARASWECGRRSLALLVVLLSFCPSFSAGASSWRLRMMFLITSPSPEH